MIKLAHMVLKGVICVHNAVADPGFPVGGAYLVGGVPTPEAATF